MCLRFKTIKQLVKSALPWRCTIEYLQCGSNVWYNYDVNAVTYRLENTTFQEDHDEYYHTVSNVYIDALSIRYSITLSISYYTTYITIITVQ